ncbi:MAG: hypothetical protein JHC71_04700 [Blastococcus sp.]|nr:hypothetical protein [Blastococcus sp.]
MTSGDRVRTALLAAVLTVGLAGCADADAEAGAPGSVAGDGPARPAAGGDDLVVEEQPLAAPVVLDPVPDGFLLTGLRYDPPGSYLLYNESSGRYEPSRATLYGDPDLADTLDGPVLLVGTSTGSASIAGPPYDVPGERTVELGGRSARVVPDTDRTWVVFEGPDSNAFVVGRGIGEGELIEAARGADFASATATVAPNAVPAGLEPLIAGSPQDGPASGSGESMSLQGDAVYVRVAAVRADPRLAALWGFWVEDATGTAVRGHPGSAGDLQGANTGDPDARGRVWSEDGMVLSVVVTGGPDRDRAGDREQVLGQVVEALRVGTWDEFQAVDGEIRTRPPTREETPCPSGGGFVSGVEGTVRWAYHLGTNPYADTEGWTTCYIELSSGGGGGTILPPPVGELVVDVMGSSTGAGGSGSTALGGVAPPGTTEVTVTGADGRVVQAQLADQGPRPGERVWGAYLLQVPPSAGGPPITVTAYDAAGAVLDSKTG